MSDATTALAAAQVATSASQTASDAADFAAEKAVEVNADRVAAQAAAAAAGAQMWVSGEAVTTATVRQAPDGSRIRSNAARTTRSTFDATEQTFWTPVLSTAGTLEQVALAATYARIGSVDVRQYGAEGDGTTDDSVAIRSAITAAVAYGAGVYLPDGTHLVSKDGANAYALSLPAGTRLHGPGSLKLANSSAISTRVVMVAGDNVTIDGISIDGNRANQSVEANAQRHGIIADTSTGLRVRNVTITGCAGDGILLSTGANGVGIDSVTITDCERNGVTFYGNAAGLANYDIAITNSHIEADVQPIDCEPTTGHVDDIRILGNHLETTSSNYALTISGSTAEASRNWSIIGNTMVGSVYFFNAEEIRVRGNGIDASASTTLNAVQAQYHTKDIDFSGNTVKAATDKYGVNLARISADRPEFWNIADNTIITSGTSARAISNTGSGPLRVHSNTLRGANGQYGVYCQTTADMESVSIVGNTIEGFATGVYTPTFSTFNYEKLEVSHNIIDNNEGTPTASYGIRLAGAAAQYLSVVMSGNTVAPIYGTDVDTLTALVRVGGTQRVPQFLGTGTPEAVVTARIGATYVDRAGTSGTTMYVKESGTGNTGWVAAASRLSATATLDFPSVAAATSQELTITVTGAAVGNAVHVGPPSTIEAGLVWNGYVSAANTVKIRVTNITAAAIDPASATWRATVIR